MYEKDLYLSCVVYFIYLQKHVGMFRCVVLIVGGLMAIFGSQGVTCPGAGPIGCLVLAYVTTYQWSKEEVWDKENVRYYTTVIYC